MGIGILTFVALVISVSWLPRSYKGIMIQSKTLAIPGGNGEKIPFSVCNQEESEMSDHISERPRSPLEM